MSLFSFQNIVLLVFSFSCFSVKADSKLNDSINTISQINQSGVSLKPSVVDPKDCPDCDKESTERALYTSCETQKKTDYTVELLNFGNAERSKLFAQEVLDTKTFSPACTKFLLEAPTLSAKAANIKCLPDSIKSKAKGFPCITSEAHRLVHNSLSTVAQCMKDFPSSPNSSYVDTLSEMLGLFSVESGLQFSAVSPTGAKGIGQLTGVAIEDVNERYFGKKNNLKEYLESHEDGRCKNLALVLAPPYSSKGNACEKVSLKDGNPAKNLLYSFAYRKIQEGYVRNSFKSKSRKDAFATPELYEKFIQKSITWSYNTGAGGYAVRAKMALDEVKKVNSEAELNALMDRIVVAFSGKTKSVACGKNPQGLRRENACYYNKIANKVVTMKESTGVPSCVK